MDYSQLEYFYTGFLTVISKAQPLSLEWGEDLEADAVDIVNPLTMIAAGTSNGVVVAAGADNAGNIYQGNRNGQTREFLPGGNTGIIGISKLSDIYVKTKNVNDSIRIQFDVYRLKG